MDKIEFAIVAQGQKVAEVAKALRIQEAAMSETIGKDTSSLAAEAKLLAGRLEMLAHDLFELASRWH